MKRWSEQTTEEKKDQLNRISWFFPILAALPLSCVLVYVFITTSITSLLGAIFVCGIAAVLASFLRIPFVKVLNQFIAKREGFQF